MALMPLNSTILVTGINGYVASHVSDQLLEAGFNVRGTVRDVRKAAGLVKIWEDKFGKGRVELVVVKDISVAGAFDSAVQGVSGIAHVASNLSLDPDPNIVVTDVISSIHSILDSAAKSPTVKSFVFTSSAAALAPPTPNISRKLTADTFNMIDVEKAWAPPPYTSERAFSVYAASKVQGEKALFTYAKEKELHFVINSLVPGVNFGKVLDWSVQGSSGYFVKEILNGQTDSVRRLSYQWFVDVQDTARLHVAALTNSGVRNERIILYAEHFTWNDVMRCLRKIRPSHKWVDDFTDGAIRDLSDIPNERGTELLKAMGRPGWTSLEDSLRMNLEGI